MDDYKRSRQRALKRNRRIARVDGFGATDQVVALTKNHLAELSRYIAGFRAAKKLHPKIRGVGDEVLAASMIAAAVEAIRYKAQPGENKTMQWFALRIGSTLEGEAWRAAFHTHNAKLAREIERFALVMWGSGKKKQRVYQTDIEAQEVVKRHAEARGFERRLWPKQTRFRIGWIGVQCLTEALPEIFYQDDQERLALSTAAQAEMGAEIVRQTLHNPLFAPLGKQPKDWTGPTGGAISDERFPPQNLIGRNHHGEVGKQVYAAVSSLQRVPFVTNVPILNLLERTGAGWKDDKVVASYLAGVERLTESSGKFWVPLRLDFRGRISPMSHFNFSREDTVRSLFLFANGELIGVEGLFWLKVHLANCAGGLWGGVRASKLTFAERVTLVDEHIEEVLAVGRTVLSDPDSQWLRNYLERVKEKKRYQFAAACVELTQATEEGPGFITRLPIAFDGSCSGFQHVCALMRCEVGAAFVNLIPNDRPQDLYQLIADDVRKENPPLAVAAGIDIDRDLTKTPTMTHNYGVTSHGARGQLMEELKDRGVHYEARVAIAKELEPMIRKAVRHRFTRAYLVYAFMRKLATVLAKRGKKMLRWQTPLGLEVENRYFTPQTQSVELWMHERPIWRTLAVDDSDEPLVGKARNSATANLIHSRDAAHLMLVALAADLERVDWVSVHDSFCCLASRAGRFRQIIHEQFVHLYRDHGDPLEAMLDQARCYLSEKELTKLQAILRERGKFIIEDVLLSEYAWA
jgi:DNA-directed RNA polymerase